MKVRKKRKIHECRGGIKNLKDYKNLIGDVAVDVEGRHAGLNILNFSSN